MTASGPAARIVERFPTDVRGHEPYAALSRVELSQALPARRGLGFNEVDIDVKCALLVKDFLPLVTFERKRVKLQAEVLTHHEDRTVKMTPGDNVRHAPPADLR